MVCTCSTAGGGGGGLWIRRRTGGAEVLEEPEDGVEPEPLDEVVPVVGVDAVSRLTDEAVGGGAELVMRSLSRSASLSDDRTIG